MADYIGLGRTNYVAITNMEALEKALECFIIEIHQREDGKVAFSDGNDDGEGWLLWGSDEEGNDVELDFATVIMPHVAEGEVLISQEAGSAGEEFVVGYAHAWIRHGEKVDKVTINLDDIVKMAAQKFGVDAGGITDCRH